MDNLGAAKLLINLRDGILDVQGSEDFVRSIYLDFKEHVAKSAISTKASLAALPIQVEELGDRSLSRVRRRERTAKTGASSTERKKRLAEYKPAFNSQLDLKGLEDWYVKFDPATHAEKILLFAIFLRDQCKIKPCSADDVFTCYRTLKDRTKTPEAFVQAFRDTKSKMHLIEYSALDDIEVTMVKSGPCWINGLGLR